MKKTIMILIVLFQYSLNLFVKLQTSLLKQEVLLSRLLHTISINRMIGGFFYASTIYNFTFTTCSVFTLFCLAIYSGSDPVAGKIILGSLVSIFSRCYRW